MKPQLRLPAVFAAAVLASTTGAVLTTASCGDDEPPACEVRCIPDGIAGGANCPGPDYPCATGPDFDQCPSGCIPEPLI